MKEAESQGVNKASVFVTYFEDKEVLLVYNQKRPVQFNITNHINRCEADALVQKEWIAGGGIYYNNTIKLFKERARQLRKIANMYDELYDHMNADSLASSDYDLSEDDLHDLLQSIGSTTISASQSTVVQLLENYKLCKAEGNKDSASALVKPLKQALGQGFDKLYIHCQAQSDPQPTTLNICRKMLYTWFRERCYWSIDRKTRPPIYNLAAVPESLDAIIIAFSIAIVQSGSYLTMYQKAIQFFDDLSEWLHNEGEGHIRGQADPYKNEGYGLVSHNIFTYVFKDSYDEDALSDTKVAKESLVFAVYLERMIKQDLYDVAEDALSNKYKHSIETRIANCRNIQLADVSTEDLYNDCKEFLNERCEEDG